MKICVHLWLNLKFAQAAKTFIHSSTKQPGRGRSIMVAANDSTQIGFAMVLRCVGKSFYLATIFGEHEISGLGGLLYVPHALLGLNVYFWPFFIHFVGGRSGKWAVLQRCKCDMSYVATYRTNISHFRRFLCMFPRSILTENLTRLRARLRRGKLTLDLRLDLHLTNQVAGPHPGLTNNLTYA